MTRRVFRIPLLCALVAASTLAAPVRVLILTGETDIPGHDWRLTTPVLRKALAGTGRFEVKVLEETRGMTAETLADYDALLLNYNGPRWNAAAEKAVEDFVRSGKGMLSLHHATYGRFFGQVFNKRWTAPPDGNPGWAAYADMLGATWKPENIGHSVRHAFPVKWTAPEHPIARGLEPSFLANDELYHKLDLRPNARVLATAYSDKAQRGTGRDEPIIWSVEYGKGRTLHISLGHDTWAMAQPGFVTAVVRGTEWVATGAVKPLEK